MKLYFGTTKRIAKKKLGRYWDKLNLGRNLKVGDIFSSCNSYNDTIIQIEPEYSCHGLQKGIVVIDFMVIGKTSSCSLIHCLTLPTWSRQEVIDRWQYYNQSHILESWKQWNMNSSLKIMEAINNGQDVFDEQGCLSLNQLREFPL